MGTKKRIYSQRNIQKIIHPPARLKERSLSDRNRREIRGRKKRGSVRARARSVTRWKFHFAARPAPANIIVNFRRGVSPAVPRRSYLRHRRPPRDARSRARARAPEKYFFPPGR